MKLAFVAEWAHQTWIMLQDAAPWLLFGFLLAGVVYVLLPARRVVAHLGTPGLAGVLKAALIGAPLPLCSCSVIPLASAMRRQGASRGATASFLISTPETGVDSIALSYALLGPLLAVARPVAALVTAVAAGMLVSVVERRRGSGVGERVAEGGERGQPLELAGTGGEAAPEPGGNRSVSGGCSGARGCAESEQGAGVPRRNRALAVLRYGFVEMFADLSHWLAAGFVVGGFLGALLPPDVLPQTIGTGLLAMALMGLLGLPMYVCATAATPVAAALLASGVTPGAALLFLLTGPATNAATMAIVARDLGRASLAIYLGTIVAVGFVLGLATDALVGLRGGGGLIEVPVQAEGGPWSAAAAVVLAGLMAAGLWRRFGGILGRRSAAAGGVQMEGCEGSDECAGCEG